MDLFVLPIFRRLRSFLLCLCAITFPSALCAQTSRPHALKKTNPTDTSPSSLTHRPATSRPTTSSRTKFSSTSQPVTAPDIAALLRRELRYDLQAAAFFRPLPFALPLEPSHLTYTRAFMIASSMKLTKQDRDLLAYLERQALREWQEGTMQRSEVRYRMHRHLRFYGLPKYRLLGFLRLKQLEEALERFLARGGSLLKRPPTHSPSFAQTLELARYAGNFPTLFSRLGVSVSAKQLSPEQRYWMRTLFLARWANQVVGVFPLPVLMGGPIYADYTRARLIFSASVERRLWAARELLNIDPTLDSARIVVWLWIQLGQPHTALRYLRETLRKEPNYRSAQQLLLLITQEPLFSPLPPIPPKKP